MKNIKKMNKTVFGHMMIVAFVGSLMLTGCKKEDVFNLRLSAEKLTSDNKTFVGGTAVGWVAGDIVRINGTEYTLVDDASVSGAAPVGSALLAFHPANICATDELPGTSQVTVTIPSSYNYETVAVGNTTKQKLDMPMVGVAAAHAHSMTMYHLCSAVDVTVTNSLSSVLTLDSIRLTGTGISGSKTVTVAANSAPTPVTGGGDGNTVQMNFSSTTIAANTGTLTVQIPVLPVTADVTVEVCGHVGIDGSLYKELYLYTRTSSVDMLRANVHGAPVSITSTNGSGHMTVTSSGGLFSVSSTKQVAFSQGNLQATTSDKGTNWSWAFATHQYDYIGGRLYGGSEPQTGNNYINGNHTVSNNGTVDLFGWSTSSTYYGIHNSENDATYTGDFVDWGPTMGSEWRTLSMAEWTWLLGPRDNPNPGTNCRTSSTVNGTTNARFAKATVNSKAGLIIFPDNYTHPSGVTQPTNINTGGAAYNGNSYSVSDWTAMENAGCAFLPAAGNRLGKTLYDIGDNGNYWSSSASSESQAMNLYFFPSNVHPQHDFYRKKGHSVRLVQDAN